MITRLVLKLSPRPTASATALCAFDSFECATRLLRELRTALPSLSAFELMWSDFVEAAMEVSSLRQPFGTAYPVYALIETLGSETQEERNWNICSARRCRPAPSATLWWRNRSMTRSGCGPIANPSPSCWRELKPFAAFDVGIPMVAMDAFVESVRDALERRFPAQRHLFFGHIGDGNLHVMSGPHEHAESLHQVEEVVYAATARMNGSISAEHGIGVIKKEFLHLSRSPDEVELMRSLKGLLDQVLKR